MPTATATATLVSTGNDDFDSATLIGGVPYSITVDTAGATRAADDPDMGAGSGQNSNTLWYRFVAASSGTLRVDTFGSNYDTVLSAFTGSRGSLSLVAASDDASFPAGTRQSEISFAVQAGTTYYLEVAEYGSGGQGSAGQLRLTVQSAAAGSTATATPSSTGTATPVALRTTTPTPTRVPTLATATGGTPATDSRYFQATSLRVDRDAFWDYFQRRGGVPTFGYPISREFTLLGFKVQLFQRILMQALPNGGVATMNLLDEGLVPYTQINFSTFPEPDRELIDGAPSPLEADYGEKAIAFLRAHVPDEWEGLSVNFLQRYLSTVRYEDAFPRGEGEAALVPLMNLEMWGLPTSKPTRDPNNHNFVYQRFQRGIMHFDATQGVTQGLLVGDYFKSIVTGHNLPPDLELQSRESRLFRQYDRARPGYLSRPGELPGTNLVGAFDLDLPE